MKVTNLEKLLLGSTVLASLAFMTPAYAQTADTDEGEVVELVEDAADEESSGSDEIIVTGSRLKKDTFNISYLFK